MLKKLGKIIASTSFIFILSACSTTQTENLFRFSVTAMAIKGLSKIEGGPVLARIYSDHNLKNKDIKNKQYCTKSVDD